MRWLENAAERGVAGSDGAAAAAVDYEANLADTALAHQCLLVIGLRSLSHARLCVEVSSISPARGAAADTLARHKATVLAGFGVGGGLEARLAADPGARAGLPPPAELRADQPGGV